MIQLVITLALLSVVILAWLIERRNRQKYRGGFRFRDPDRIRQTRWWNEPPEDDDVEGDR